MWKWILIILVAELLMLVVWFLIDRSMGGVIEARPPAASPLPEPGEDPEDGAFPANNNQAKLEHEGDKMKSTHSRSYGLFAGLILSLSMLLPAMAQHEQHHPMQKQEDGSMQAQAGAQGTDMHAMHNAMQGGMPGERMGGDAEAMHSAMFSPLCRTMVTARLLPSMGEALSLSDDQLSDLAQAKRMFTEQEEELRAEVSKVSKNLESLFETSLQSDTETVRSDLKRRASLAADLELLNYETTARMLSLLSPEQRSRLHDLTPMQLQHIMMSNMTDSEMHTMHSAMMSGMDCPMMSGDMMGGPMDDASQESGSH